MYSPRLYKYRDSYELEIPTVHAFGSLNFTHAFGTHTHEVSYPWGGASTLLLEERTELPPVEIKVGKFSNSSNR